MNGSRPTDSHEISHRCSSTSSLGMFQNKPRLSGERMSECAACHRFFTSTANFDKHRAWADHDGNIWSGRNRPATHDQRVCVDPEMTGLVLRDNGAWGNPPMTDEQKKAMGWS